MFFEHDQHSGHVVAADATRFLCVRRNSLIKQFFDNLLQVGFQNVFTLFSKSFVDPFDHFFVGFNFPDTIATDKYEVSICGEVILISVRVGGDGLFLRLKLLLLFVFEVTKSATEVQVTVNAAFGHYGSSSVDSVAFNFIFRLVVKTEWNALSTLTHN